MQTKLQTALTRLLLAFVLISIGFALGKEAALRSIKTEVPATAPTEKSERPHLVVYYMHASFRCATCNSIEQMTKDLLDSEFADEMADGRILWREENFQTNEALAEKFDVIASVVVVAKYHGDDIVEFKRLDEVWTLVGSPADFNAYIGDAVRALLPPAEQGEAR